MTGAFRNHASSSVPVLVFKVVCDSRSDRKRAHSTTWGRSGHSTQETSLPAGIGTGSVADIVEPTPRSSEHGRRLSAHLPSTWEPPPWRLGPAPRHQGAHHRRLTHRQGQCAMLQNRLPQIQGETTPETRFHWAVSPAPSVSHRCHLTTLHQEPHPQGAWAQAQLLQTQAEQPRAES